MRSTLRRDLTAAVKAKDRVAVSALRSALAAIDNAEAPPVQEYAAEIAAGTTEVERRRLSDAELLAIVTGEVRQRTTAADEYDRLGRADPATRLRAEADVLRRYLPSPTPGVN